MGMLITWPNPDITGWFVAWTVLVIMSYIVGIIACKQHAEAQHAAQSDVWLAIIAQILLPLGVAIVVIIIIAMMLGVFGGGSKKKRKYSDPQGCVTAGWGLCMSAKDMAVIGSMVLGGGLYNGKRIISEEYLKEMLAPHLKLGERFGFMNYGYLWYKPYDDKEVYAAIGDSGNIIYVNKENNVSVGITGTFKVRIFDRVEFEYFGL